MKTQSVRVYSIFREGSTRYSTAPADLKVYAYGAKDSVPGTGELPDKDQVQVCMNFLERCTPTKTGRVISYGLKHTIEQESDAVGGMSYVSNGACIEAARRLGLVLLTSPTCPNAVIGVSRRSVRVAAMMAGWRYTREARSQQRIKGMPSKCYASY
jgi:hypothetical protein